MKALLQQQALRINALTLRERAIMFISLAAALVAATDALVLSPRQAEQKALAQQLRQQSSDVDALRAQVAGPALADTPQARLARELLQLRTRQAEVNAEIQRRAGSGASAMRLPTLLERVLRRHDRLTLVRLATLAPPVTSNTTVTPNTTTTPKPGALPLQGVEIVLRGPYPDLVRYVAEAEQAMPGLRWGELHISTRQDTPALPELVAKVTLLGEAP